MNNTSTGNKIAAAIEPTETILVNAIRMSANTKQINPICQFVISKTPSAVATPFPPLKRKNTGKVCPNITNTPANCINKALSKPEKIFPVKKLLLRYRKLK